MNSVSKKVYIYKLEDIVNKHNDTYHSTIKMKPVDAKSNTYINSGKEINDKDPQFKFGCIVRISKYKNIFAKGSVPNWSKEPFVIKKVKNNVPLLVILKAKKLLERFMEKNCKKQIKKSLESKK